VEEVGGLVLFLEGGVPVDEGVGLGGIPEFRVSAFLSWCFIVREGGLAGSIKIAI